VYCLLGNIEPDIVYRDNETMVTWAKAEVVRRYIAEQIGWPAQKAEQREERRDEVKAMYDRMNANLASIRKVVPPNA
jgi:hypothetical protein